MELRCSIQSFLNEFCRQRKLYPVPQARLIQNTSQRKNCGDFNIFIKQPTFDVLKPHFEEIAEELPNHSVSWNLPLHSVIYSPKSAYLELFLNRPLAFKLLFRSITDFSWPKVSTPRKLLIVYAPEQPPFDLKRSDMLSVYIQVQYISCGFDIEIVTDLPDSGEELMPEEYEGNPYFDKDKMAFDLRKYLEDEDMVDEFDINIGYCYLDSAAVGIAARIRSLLEGGQDVTLCHLVPQNKAYVEQQSALILEILGVRLRKQVFVVHGGTDARDISVEVYEKDIADYVRESLQQRRIDVEDPQWKQSIATLTMTKVKFDLLTCRQTARLKIPSKEKGGSFDGKGGIFVQYTCARLAVLLRNYDRGVDDGKYPTPNVSKLSYQDLDLSCLSLEQDWILWRICYRCSSILERCATLPVSEELPVKADMLSHSVCEILIAMCVEFSTYYSKVRILVENQPHLMGVLKCRVFLLKVVQILLHRGLNMLGLTAVEKM